jgi:hypothetical protein
LARRRSRHIVGSFLASAFLSSSSSLRLLFSILIKSLPFTFYDLHVVAMPERRCAYYYRAMILLCRASPPSPSRFYSLDMARVISYTVDEVFRSCFFLFSLDARDQLGIRSYTNHCGGYFTMYFYSHRPWKITTSMYVQQHFSCFCLYSWLFFSIKHVHRIWALLFKSAFIVKHPIGSTPKKNCLLNTLESA